MRNISAGPALLYRLLETYPRENLLIAESDDNTPQPAVQLSVPHLRFFLLHRRLLQSRLSRIYGTLTYLRAPARGRNLAAKLSRSFRPEAILGIAHGFGWRTAAATAASLGVPLHLIAHDHWRSFLSILPRMSMIAERNFGVVYRSAACRMPVSPDMEQDYRRRYGAAGVVVYPCRSANALALASPPLRDPQPSNFVFAYAGSSSSVGQRRTLADFANATAGLGVRLRIYQGITLAQLREVGLHTGNVDIVPFRPATELHCDLVESVDAMYLPMSFTTEDRDNVKLCFPSKLTDYTVAGLPILVRAPEYGTATHWARQFSHAAALVTTEDAAELATAVRKIIDDKQYRHALARGALDVGHRLFSQAAVFQMFVRALCDARP